MMYCFGSSTPCVGFGVFAQSSFWNAAATPARLVASLPGSGSRAPTAAADDEGDGDGEPDALGDAEADADGDGLGVACSSAAGSRSFDVVFDAVGEGLMVMAVDGADDPAAEADALGTGAAVAAPAAST